MITEEQEYELFVEYEKLKDLSYKDGIPDDIRQKMRDIAYKMEDIVGYKIG